MVTLSDGARQTLRNVMAGGAGNDIINLFDSMSNRLAALEGARFKKDGIPAKAVKAKVKAKAEEEPAHAAHHSPAHGAAHGHR